MDVITFSEYLLTTSGLSILLHGVISLQDARRHMIIYFVSLLECYGTMIQLLLNKSRLILSFYLCP